MPSEVVNNYHQAPLDSVSLYNGVFKFTTRPVVELRESDIQYSVWCLEQLFPLLPHCLAKDKEILESLSSVNDSSAGFPYCELGCVYKGDVVKKFGLQHIKDTYNHYTPVISSTMKDELRLVGKDARLFRPADISMYVEGCRLFYHQNEYIMSKLFTSPVFVKFVTPGNHLRIMRDLLAEHGGACYGYDGDQWDTKFPYVAMNALMRFRGATKDIFRYYQNTYFGFTSVEGHLLQLDGNPSGHFNTTVDNTLANCIMMCLHARRMGIPFSTFRSEVLFYQCGDDCIYSDRTGKFTPELVTETYLQHGVYLSFEHLQPRKPNDVTFVGTLGVPGGYYYNHTKLEASFQIDHISASAMDILSKKVSITILLFYTPYFNIFKERTFEFARQNAVVLDSEISAKLCGLLSEHSVIQLYRRREFLNFSFDPDTITTGKIKEFAGLKSST